MAKVISTEELVEEFELYGIELESSSSAIKEFQGLCAQYKKDASHMAAQWVAFINSKQLEPSPGGETLYLFEKERLVKDHKVLGKENSNPVNANGFLSDLQTTDEVNELCSAYSLPTTDVVSNKRQLTPDNSISKRLAASERTPSLIFSPASFSPLGRATSKKYGSRTNSGEILESFNVTEQTKWTKMDPNGLQMSICPYDENSYLSSNYRYMFQKLVDKCHVLNDSVDEMADKLQKLHGIADYANVSHTQMDLTSVVGRIYCDGDGRLNPKAVILEGSSRTSQGRRIAVDLSHLKEYSLFPGQVVAFQGINLTGQVFMAKEQYQGCLPDKPLIKSLVKSDKSLNTVIVCGPYSISDDLSYDPLDDLLNYIRTNKPDVIIMIGPFVDSKNNLIETGNTGVLYEDVFSAVIEKIQKITDRLDCHVLLVPSYRDIHHDYVYPQPPFVISRSSQKIHCLPDPAIIRINDVIFAVTSTDILFHLGQEEISFTSGSQRLSRLLHHVLTQHSFYPLCPPMKDVPLDYDHLELYGGLSVLPDVLIVPSDLRYFIKKINECICVNPGRLTKGHVGGTIARLNITTCDPDHNNCDRFSAEVLRI